MTNPIKRDTIADLVAHQLALAAAAAVYTVINSFILLHPSSIQKETPREMKTSVPIYINK